MHINYLDTYIINVNVCLCFLQRNQEGDEVVYAGIAVRC